MAKNRLIANLSRISLGLILVLIWGFMWIRADLFFPINTEIWEKMILTYIVLTAFIFSWDTATGSKTESDLFKLSFLKRFPTFLISSTITLVGLIILGLFIPGDSINSIQTAMVGVGVGVLFLHAFIVAIGEELIFRGWVVERLREARISPNSIMWISSIAFALFHAGMGKSIFTMLLYIPLGILFYTTKRRFSPQTNMANAGIHFAWNIFVLGFLG